jgi:branched-chain amino acid transport system permease protein
MQYFWQLVITGLLYGSVLSLVGVGFTIVLGVGKIANFAHGAFVGLGMYLGYWAGADLKISPYLMLIPGLIAFLLVGWGAAELFEWRGRRVGAIGELLVGLAMLLFINGLLAVIFGADPRTLSDVDYGHIDVAGLRIPMTEIIAALFTLAVAVGTYFFVRVSRWGRALRAVAENPPAAGLYGIRVPVAQRIAVTASIVLAGISGLMISPFSVMTPDVGSSFLITAFAVVIIGGIGNTVGAVFAGLAIGVVDALAVGYLSNVWTTLAPLLLILGFLLARPVTVDA